MNQPITLSIGKNHFDAVALFRANKDIRWYLNGLLFDTGPKGAFLVGSNGYALAVHCVNQDPLPELQLIIPPDVVNLVTKLKNKANPTITFDLGNLYGGSRDHTQLRKAQLRSTDEHHVFREVEGTYPDWRRVAKFKKHESEPTFYNPDYIALVNKAGKKIKGSDTLTLICSGSADSTGFARLDNFGFTCAWVMPVNTKISDLPTNPGFTFY